MSWSRFRPKRIIAEREWLALVGVGWLVLVIVARAW